jgi:hypothetical protein
MLLFHPLISAANFEDHLSSSSLCNSQVYGEYLNPKKQFQSINQLLRVKLFQYIKICTAESGDFEVADSSGRFRRIGHFS